MIALCMHPPQLRPFGSSEETKKELFIILIIIVVRNAFMSGYFEKFSVCSFDVTEVIG